MESLYCTRIYYLVQLTGGQKDNNNPLCFVKQIQSLSVTQGGEVFNKFCGDLCDGQIYLQLYFVASR